MNKKIRMLILNQLKNNYAGSKISLKYKTKFELLIAIILSAKSSDIQVNKVTKKLFLYVSHPLDVLKLGLKKLKNIIRFVGLFNRKSIYIIRLCMILVEQYNGNIPCNLKRLLSFPGVGRKTANLFLNIILKKNFIAVDTHVFRISNRTGFATGTSVFSVEKKLLKVVPICFQSYINTWFVLHGRNFCRSISPICLTCSIRTFCKYYNKKF